MATTILIPGPNAPFGVAFSLIANSNFVGPLSNPRFQCDVQTTDLAHLLYAMTFPLVGGSLSMNTFFLGISSMPPPNSYAKSGDAVTLTVRLIADSGTIETATVNVTLDEQQGRLYVLSIKISALGSVSSNLAQILAAVRRTF